VEPRESNPKLRRFSPAVLPENLDKHPFTSRSILLDPVPSRPGVHMYAHKNYRLRKQCRAAQISSITVLNMF